MIVLYNKQARLDREKERHLKRRYLVEVEYRFYGSSERTYTVEYRYRTALGARRDTLRFRRDYYCIEIRLIDTKHEPR